MKAAPSAVFQVPFCQRERRRASGASREAASLARNTAAPAIAAICQGKPTNPAAADEVSTKRLDWPAH
jgi:hypothetical protein